MRLLRFNQCAKMILHSVAGFESPAHGKIVEATYTVCKQFMARRFGSICRFGAIALLLFALYLASSYILSGKVPEIEYFGNETAYIGSDFIPDIGFPLKKSLVSRQALVLSPGIKFGDHLLNCGVPKPCKSDEFSVHIYTGKDHRDEPRLCLDGRYVLTKSVNGGGRGINVVVIDNMTRTVSRVSHFDTYDKDSTGLETLLLTLRPGDIIILLTFDEPTRKMTRVARLLLYELGSALIQNLSYRGSWYLVTQKGMTGFSPFESLHTAETSGWPRHHDVHFCVPFRIEGQVIHPDPLPRTNGQRVEFCQKNGEYPLFCDADAVNEPLLPIPVKSVSAIGRIYTVPIIILTGTNIAYLPVMLETLVRQSGLNPSLVVVFYLPHKLEVPSLCDLFGFMSVELTQSGSYCEHVKEVFGTGRLLFPDSKEFIFLQDNMVLSADFLLYFGQTLPLFEQDRLLISVSAFNENGFEGVSEDPTLLYRVESFSALAILVRQKFFQNHWCGNGTDSDPLFISNAIQGDSLIPDVSRVLHVPSEGYSNSLSSSTFIRKRAVSYEDHAVLKEVDECLKRNYGKRIEFLLDTATPLPIDVISDDLECSQDSSKIPFFQKIDNILAIMNVSSTSELYSIYVYQANDRDYSAFKIICQCFGLFHHSLYSPKGLYKNMLRFTLKGHQVLVVGSASPFYKHKPSDLQPLVGSNVFLK